MLDKNEAYVIVEKPIVFAALMYLELVYIWLLDTVASFTM